MTMSTGANLIGESREKRTKGKAKNFTVLVSLSCWGNKHLPALLWTHDSVILGKSLHLSVPQFPHLQNGGNMPSTYLTGVVWGLERWSLAFCPGLQWGLRVRVLELLRCRGIPSTHSAQHSCRPTLPNAGHCRHSPTTPTHQWFRDNRSNLF